MPKSPATTKGQNDFLDEIESMNPQVAADMDSSGTSNPSTEPPQPAEPPPLQSLPPHRNKWVVLLILFIAVTIPMVVYLAQQKQDLRQRAQVYPCQPTSIDGCAGQNAGATCFNSALNEQGTCNFNPAGTACYCHAASCNIPSPLTGDPGYCDFSNPNTFQCTDKKEGDPCDFSQACGGSGGEPDDGVCVVTSGGPTQYGCHCASGGGGPAPTPTPSPTPIATPTPPPPQCGTNCSTNPTICNSIGLTCYQGTCRNPNCQDDFDCNCSAGCTKSCTNTAVTKSINQLPMCSEATYTVTLTGNIQLCGEPTTLKFPTWSQTGGQNDIVWYDPTPTGPNTWQLNINSANHPGNNGELIYTDIWVTSPSIYCGGTNILRQCLTPSPTPTPSPPGLTLTLSNVCVQPSPYVRLDWTATPTPSSLYSIERCTGATCSNFVEVLTRTGGNFVADTNVVVGTTYRYRVREVFASSGTYGPYSNISQITFNCTFSSPSPSPAPFCADIRIYSVTGAITNPANWTRLTQAQMNALHAGNTIYISIVGSSQNAPVVFNRGRIRVNIGSTVGTFTETTSIKPKVVSTDPDEFYISYQIPTNLSANTTFGPQGELCVLTGSTCNWY